MAEENNKNVVSDELDEKVKNPEVEVEREEISDKELNEVSGGVRKNNLEVSFRRY
ncbi:MAG: bacteriocin [Bacteroidaceae bacterium]|jgi:bacteriocin-like protein|nr:bacteriocin [Bacteroidaceae bacterium]